MVCQGELIWSVTLPVLEIIKNEFVNKWRSCVLAQIEAYYIVCCVSERFFS